MNAIYLDHAASTPILPEVVDAMMPFLNQHFGNPSSVHHYGRQAKNAVDEARLKIAQAIGCQPAELIFTSGGTESDNLAILGTLLRHPKGTHMITTAIEHPAVLRTCEFAEQLGYEVTYISPDSTGIISLEAIRSAVKKHTVLISVIYGNNEVGTLQPVEQIGEFARSRNITMHVDAVQAAGVIRLNMAALPIDLLSLSSHKLNGPKGCGLLYVSRNTALSPMMHGGSQERKTRAGTENVSAIVGFGKAVEMRYNILEHHAQYLDNLRTKMLDIFAAELTDDQYVVNGHLSERLPHILNVSFPGIRSESLLMNLDMEKIAASSGSACSSGSIQPSHVLQAMKLPDSICASAIRFSFGIGNTADDVMQAASRIANIVKRIGNRQQV